MNLTINLVFNHIEADCTHLDGTTVLNLSQKQILWLKLFGVTLQALIDGNGATFEDQACVCVFYWKAFFDEVSLATACEKHCCNSN